jgi:hypothetical protein
MFNLDTSLEFIRKYTGSFYQIYIKPANVLTRYIGGLLSFYRIEQQSKITECSDQRLGSILTMAGLTENGTPVPKQQRRR